MAHNTTRDGRGLICPYCVARQSDSWEMAGVDSPQEMECGWCEKKFIGWAEMTVDYLTRPIEGVE